ncbi:MAG TPA: PadR family transcriptional regulator [Clostridia bacterium]
MDNYINSDLIRGNIDTIILRSLSEGDKYGYEILKEIESKTQGEYILKQPTLYSCLKRLEQQGYITSFWGQITLGGRRKYYRLTPAGKEYFEKVQADWEYSRALIDKLIAKRRNNPQIESENSQEFNLDDKQTNASFIRHFEGDDNKLSYENDLEKVEEIVEENKADIKPDLNQALSEQSGENINFENAKLADALNADNNSADNAIVDNTLEANENLKDDNTSKQEKEEQKTEERKQIFIVAKPREDYKDNTSENRVKPQGIAIYTPLKGKPIFAKSDRVLAEFQSSADNIDNPKEFKPKVENRIDHIENETSKSYEKSYDKTESLETLNQSINQYLFKKEPREEDNSLVGATKINYVADDVFFANQLPKNKSNFHSSYEDLLLQQKMELLKENLNKYKKSSAQADSAPDSQLYSLPDNSLPDFNDTISPASGVTFASIEEAQQAFKLEKQYKNVLGKLFENKNKEEIKIEKPAKHSEPQETIVNNYKTERNNADSYNNYNYYAREYHDIKVSPFSKHTISEYYSSYYVYYNKFKLAQHLIFSALMFLINIGLYFLFNTLFHLNIKIGYFFAGGLAAALFALIAILAFFYKPNRKKKVYYDFGKDFLKKFYLWLVISAAFILGFYLADKSLFDNLARFSKVLYAISLSLSVITLPIIAKIMLKLKAFSVKS